MTDTLSRYYRIIREHLGVAAEQITDDAEFADDLKADSLDMVELTMALEEEFEIEVADDEAAAVVTVKNGLDLVERLLAGQPAAA